MSSDYGRFTVHAEYFLFKGISCKDYGIKMLSFPSRTSPAVFGTSTDVSGRDGDLWTSDNTRKTYELSVRCSVRQSKLAAAINWLQGSGEFVFSSALTEAIRCRISDTTGFQRVTNDRDPLYTFEVKFTCQPFVYIRPAADDIVITASNTAVINPYTAASAPVIKIAGSGDFDVMIGQQIVSLTGVTGGGIILNTELLDAFTYDGAELANEHMTGDFFVLYPGTQYVAWSPAANVSSITITPNWRNL